MVGPAAVKEEAETINGEQVAQGPLPVRAAQRRHLHRRPHLIPPAATDGGGEWSRALRAGLIEEKLWTARDGGCK